MRIRIVSSILILILISVSALSQRAVHSSRINFTAGKIFFGTGDFNGYNVDLGYFKRLSTRGFFSHVLAGAEISFENGSANPKVINPTVEEFYAKTFFAATNCVFIPTVEYFPIHSTFLKGLSVSAGAAVGYTNQSFEFQASWIYDNATQTSVRRSYLDYIRKMFVGYKITAGYTYDLQKHFSVGGRLEFENYSGDINSLICGRIAYRFM